MVLKYREGQKVLVHILQSGRLRNSTSPAKLSGKLFSKPARYVQGLFDPHGTDVDEMDTVSENDRESRGYGAIPSVAGSVDMHSHIKE